jgi:hypothetical protein
MKRMDLGLIINAQFADREPGQPKSEVGISRDEQLFKQVSTLEDLVSLRLANEASIEWAEETGKYVGQKSLPRSTASLQRVAEAVKAGEARIVAQENLIERLNVRGWSNQTAVELLETMRSILLTLRVRLELLEEEAGSKVSRDRGEG